ncbi:MAG: DUF416 family protein [Cyanobacteriota bacterium]|nr:DUF416 family protein [Cyanobacteriota bacterium]
MKPLFYDLDFLEEELKLLPHLHRVAFAASICERMLPMYRKFYQIENWGRPSVLREALDEVWAILEGKPMDSSKLSQLMEDCACEDVCPHTEEYNFCNTDYLYEAQFTVSAVYSTLTALLTSDLKYIIGVVGNVRFETIEGFISERDKLYEVNSLQIVMEAIANDPLAKHEMAKEMEDIQKLKNAKKLEPELLQWLENKSQNDRESLIDLYSNPI